MYIFMVFRVFQISGKQLPDWGFHQLEVVTDRVVNHEATVWNVEEHRYSKSKLFSITFKLSLLHTFVHSNMPASFPILPINPHMC